MSQPSPFAIPTDFNWDPEYETLLEQIANTDAVDYEWTKLRDIIKFKIQKNIDSFLSVGPPPPPTNLIRSPKLDPAGGLKLPPFGPRKGNQLGVPEIPPNYMTLAQANQAKDDIFEQLHTFDSNPPFTIQRICELGLHPTQHYNCAGKYLRALEKSILVTSTWDAFPPLSENDKKPFLDALVGVSPVPSSSMSTPSTPLFSPIPFLHEDARRSKSRSPPPLPSPLALNPVAGPGVIEPLGLVDELDDPVGPEHMSDHPTALTSVTTTAPASVTEAGSSKGGKPFLGSLVDRFVPGVTESQEVEMQSEEKSDKEGKT